MSDDTAAERGGDQSSPETPILAEESFRRLFALVAVTDEETINDYLACLNEQGIYNVRLLLRGLCGLHDQDSVVGALVRVKIRSVHAVEISHFLMGDYTAVEEILVQRGLIRAVDASGDWTELLNSLDIFPSAQLANQLVRATTLTLHSLLQQLHRTPELQKHILQDIVHRVPVFRETAHLIDVLDSALCRAIQQLAQAAPTASQLTVLGPADGVPVSEDQRVLGPAPAPSTICLSSSFTATKVFSGQKEELLGHHWTVCRLCLLPNNVLVSASWDWTLRLWNLAAQECIQVLEGHDVWCVAALSADQLITGGNDYVLRLWNVTTGEVEPIFEAQGSDRISSLVVLSSERVVTSSLDGWVIIWTVPDGSLITELECGLGQCLCLTALHTLLSTQPVIAAGYSDGRIVLWDLPTESTLRVLSGHADVVSCLCALPSSADRLASGSWDCTIRLWNYVSSECLSIFRGHGDNIECLCVLSDGRLVSGGGNGNHRHGGDTKIRIWNTETAECTQVLEGHTDVVYSLLPLSDGRLVSGGQDKRILIWS